MLKCGRKVDSTQLQVVDGIALSYQNVNGLENVLDKEDMKPHLLSLYIHGKL